LIVPTGFTDAGAARVAWTAAVGTGVGVTPPIADGCEVGSGTDVGGVELVLLLGGGVAVAEDPQANSRTTNSRTIALGRCLNSHGLDLDIGRAPSPDLRFAGTYRILLGIHHHRMHFAHIFTLMIYMSLSASCQYRYSDNN